MAKNSATPKHMAPEVFHQGEPEDTGGSIRKVEAVGQAVAAGNDSPEEGIGSLNRIHEIEMI